MSCEVHLPCSRLAHEAESRQFRVGPEEILPSELLSLCVPSPLVLIVEQKEVHIVGLRIDDRREFEYDGDQQCLLLVRDALAPVRPIVIRPPPGVLELLVPLHCSIEVHFERRRPVRVFACLRTAKVHDIVWPLSTTLKFVHLLESGLACRVSATLVEADDNCLRVVHSAQPERVTVCGIGEDEVKQGWYLLSDVSVLHFKAPIELDLLAVTADPQELEPVPNEERRVVLSPESIIVVITVLCVDCAIRDIRICAEICL